MAKIIKEIEIPLTLEIEIITYPGEPATNDSPEYPPDYDIESIKILIPKELKNESLENYISILCNDELENHFLINDLDFSEEY